MASTWSAEARAAVHAALADAHRVEIVDELALSDRSPSELKAALGLESNLLAHHLDVLEEAGVIERTSSSGDRRRRYVRLLPGALEAAVSPVRSYVARSVLFICLANSARSQLAEATWNSRHEVPASSAGTEPADRVRAKAVEAGLRLGLDISSAIPRSIDDLTERPDLIVTVCDVAHESLRGWFADVPMIHWSIPDPVRAGTPRAFDAALRRISERIDVLAPRVRPLVPRAGRAGRTIGLKDDPTWKNASRV
ncbi:MAG TPA: helix-turn-helix domain-containing protein [Actinomycetota bacterium]|nr:helix-turn-helix domain-containing protein [Actinomycetota bacterium]